MAGMGMRKGRTWVVVVVWVVAGFLIAAGVRFAIFHGILPSDATVSSSGFTEIRFRQVRAGMSKSEVRGLLGAPLKSDGKGNICLADDPDLWVYSHLDRSRIHIEDRVTNTWFRVREVHFDRSGRVKRVVISTEQYE